MKTSLKTKKTLIFELMKPNQKEKLPNQIKKILEEIFWKSAQI